MSTKIVGGRRVPRGKSARAALQFPVARIARQLKKRNLSNRLSASAPVFLAAVLEYLCAEILDLSGHATGAQSRIRITPRDIQIAIRNDDELSLLLQDTTIAGGGVMPNIHSVLLPKKSKTSTNDLALLGA